MAETPGTKMAPVFEHSPMPVLLTNPTPDARYDNRPTVRVEPGLIRLGSGQQRLTEVVWLNETGDDVTFTFDAASSAKFFDLTTKGPGPFTIKNNEPLRLKVAQNAPENSIYSYHVDCKATPGLPAQGNSPPQVSCP
jgi:hypothetical protein